VLLSAAWAAILLAHALAGAKRALILDDGDTVLLPLMVRSFEHGQAIEWGMSPVLFVFPELPLYLLAAAVTTTVSAALLLNGVLNVVILYGLLRAVAGRVTTRPAMRVGAALAGVLLLAVLSLCETRSGGNTGEIASLYLTTTYYSGTVMALVAAIALVLSLTAAREGRGPTRIRLALAALALLSALATLSNPLYLLWATAPLAVTAGVVGLLRQGRRDDLATRSRARPALTAGVLVVGSALGWLAREPLQRFIIADKTEYLRWGGEAASVAFFRDSIAWLVRTPGGAVEAALGVLLTGAVGVITVVRLVRGHRDPATVAGVVALATVVVVPAGLLVTGTLSTRYAMPLLFAPLVALVALAADAPALRIRRRPTRALGALAAVAALGAASRGVAVPASARVVAAGRSLGEPAAACLTDWARGTDVAGVAQFWTGRGLQAYGGADVHLLQVNGDFSVYPWLTNLAAYEDARVGYVVVATGTTPGDHLEGWGDSVTRLGTPRAVVHCDGYDIVDFRGTPAEAALTEKVRESARAQALTRGFPW
jgi:hypothetical protein